MIEQSRLRLRQRKLKNTLVGRRTAYKRINFSHLVDILYQICQLSAVERSGKTSSWDLDLSVPYLEQNGFGAYISFISFKARNKKFPLNSERHLYETTNIVLQNLEVALDDRDAWQTHDNWTPLDQAKWHFEHCRFVPIAGSSYSGPFNFPWHGSFRFYKNDFEFQAYGVLGSTLFNFCTGSRVLFQGNDFHHNSIQTRCERATTHSAVGAWGSISFVGNKNISSLYLGEGYSSISLTGMNQIEHLSLFNSRTKTDAHKQHFYFGAREKIDPHFHYCLQHKKLFLKLKRIAAANHDTRQLNVMDRNLDRIEYFMNKEQAFPSPFDWNIWLEYWQDRTLYSWRRWSSNFYKSWLRPLIMMVLGYVVLNAIPILLISSFSLSDWIEFTLRPIEDIARYESSLSIIVGEQYKRTSLLCRNAFKLVGLIQLIWLTMWSFAFVQSIRK